jgi:hypothetical protein
LTHLEDPSMAGGSGRGEGDETAAYDQSYRPVNLQIPFTRRPRYFIVEAAEIDFH